MGAFWFNQVDFKMIHNFLCTIICVCVCVLGQMMWMESLDCMIYLCSPKLRSLQELEERGLHLADIAQHDTTRDLILLNQQRLAEIELSNQLERKKEELRILSRNLEIEKQKSEKLLYAMLPSHVANQLKEGKRVEAGDETRGSPNRTLLYLSLFMLYMDNTLSVTLSGEFKVCTVLFSDVVTFTNICAACEPIQIVNMLNAMYSRFDRLTNIHNVYKVCRMIISIYLSVCVSVCLSPVCLSVRPYIYMYYMNVIYKYIKTWVVTDYM